MYKKRDLKKTHDEFLAELLLRNEQYRSGEITIEGKYGGIRERILVKGAFGLCNPIAANLLVTSKVTIVASVDKTEYFKNKLLTKNELYASGGFKIVGNYKTNRTTIRVQDEY